MKNCGFKLLCLLVCFALLTGCNGMTFTPEGAIRAPRAAGIYRGVQDALELAVGGDVVLKYPLVGNTNTAFSPCDFEGDGKAEMLAFYRLPSEGEVTRVNLIRQIDGDWQSVQEIETEGSDIAHVDYCDLNGDGRDELCIGWSVYTTRSNLMCVYQYENGMLVQRAAEPYTKHVICDIDGDGVKELGLALLDTTTNTSAISFYEIEKDGVSVLGTLELDRGVASYAQMVAGSITSNQIGVYLDAHKGTENTITELIYLKDGRLYNPFASSVDNANVATLRYAKILSTDVNKDGLLEIPFMEPLPGYEGTEEEAPVERIDRNLICWRAFNGNVGDPMAVWWYNPVEGYYFAIDGSRRGEFTVLYSESTKEYDFYLWDGTALSRRLFSIKSFTVEDWEARTSVDYVELNSDGKTVWAASIVNDNAWGMTYEDAKARFHLILK